MKINPEQLAEMEARVAAGDLPNFGIKCWACGYANRGDCAIDGDKLIFDRTPRSGDLMVCCGCGRLNIVTMTHTTRQPLRAEMNKLWAESPDEMRKICLASLQIMALRL